MSLWKRGKRYHTIFKIDGVLYRKPLCPPGQNRATTNWQEATRLEKVLIAEAQAGRLAATREGNPTRLFAACDAFLAAKRTVANRERTVVFTEERLAIVRGVLGDLPLARITRETIEGLQATRKAAGAGNRTINMDVGALRQVLKRYNHWRRLEDHVQMLTETGEGVGQVLSAEQRQRLIDTARQNPEWEHVWCAAQLAANTSMRGIEVKHLRRKDVDLDKAMLHIRHSKNETSRRVIPLNAPALEAVMRMLLKADLLGHTEPEHYLWFGSRYEQAERAGGGGRRTTQRHRVFDPTVPVASWDNAWRALRVAAKLPPGFRFHDLRHTVVTELLEAGEPDHVVESITGHLGKKMLQHYSHIRLRAKKDALDRLDESRKALPK